MGRFDDENFGGDRLSSNDFKAVYENWLQNPEGFWAEAAKDIVWNRPADRILDYDNPPHARWFQGGVLNICYNALDRHVEAGRGQQAALMYDSPLTGQGATLTYEDLLDKVARCAGALAERGVGKGDRVIIYMPMIPQAVIAMLASARLGAIHSVVFGGFAGRELAVRIDDARPKAIITASCGIEPARIVPYKPMLDEAISIARHKPDFCLIVARPQERASLGPLDVDWEEALLKATAHPPVPVSATDPLYILYTSGTTGQPKGVVRDCGGYGVALKWSMRTVYDIAPGEVFWAASDVGWVVGHSYIVYGPLLQGATTVLYEGKPVGTPDAGAFWRVIQDHKVAAMFTAPTAFRAIRQQDPEGSLIQDYDLSHLRALFLAGERLDPDTLAWAERKLAVPVIDNWWQTETGWPITANCLGIERLPIKSGSSTRPVPGWNLRVLDPDGQPLEAGKLGMLAAKLPLPPGAFTTLWQADDRYVESYFQDFPGYYKTGDAGYIDEDGYVFVMTRSDDIINVSGHRLSTGSIEEVLAAHPDVAECAVIGIDDALKGQVPLGLLVLNAGVTRSKERIVAEVIAKVREEIGPVASFKKAVIVKRLPKTRSGKILRAVLRSMADGKSFTLPPTIDDPAALDEVARDLAALKQRK